MRGKKSKIKEIKPDSKYQSPIVGRLINKVMLHGEKITAINAVYESMESVAKELSLNPIEFLNTVVDNLRPALEIKSRRVGGANYSVPVPVSARRQEALAIRWLVDAARAKSGASFVDRLKKEMLDAYNKSGSAVEKKTNVEKMAEANKAFAHFR